MLECQRELFELPTNIHFLNCAYMSPLMKSVVDAGIDGIKEKTRPYQVVPEDFFTDSNTLRELFAELIEVNKPGQIVNIPSVSYGIACVAQNVYPTSEQNIVVVEEQFPSNIYTWQRLAQTTGCELRMVAAPNQGTPGRGEIWNNNILGAIDDKTCLISLPHIHWADGTLFDLANIREKSIQKGALLVIDGTQSIGALPFSVAEFEPDAVICAGYKWLMGPYSIGLAYFGPHFDTGVPLEENWINRLNSEHFGGLVNYQEQYQPGALRYEVGEHSNFVLVPMLIESLKQILKWRPENIQDYCASISTEVLDRLKTKGFSIEEFPRRGHHLFGIRLPHGYDAQALSERLRANRVFVSVRGTAIRVSPHMYNKKEDMEALERCFVEGL